MRFIFVMKNQQLNNLRIGLIMLFEYKMTNRSLRSMLLEPIEDKSLVSRDRCLVKERDQAAMTVFRYTSEKYFNVEETTHSRL